MDNIIQNAWGILGLLGTVIFGFVSIRQAIKHKNKTELIYFNHSNTSLFNSVVKNIDNIDVTYKGSKIKENLILFKGTIFNTGNIDIDRNIVHDPLKLQFPDTYRVLECKVVNNSDGLAINVDTKESILTFDWSLLKAGEYFTIEGIIEYLPKEDEKHDIPSMNLSKEMKLIHRIKGLKDVRKEKLTFPTSSQNVLALIIIMYFAFSIFLLYSSIGKRYFFPDYTLYNEVLIDSSVHYVNLEAKNINIVSLYDENKNFITKIPAKNLSSIMTGNIKLFKKDINTVEYYAVLIFALVVLISTIFLTVTLYYKRQLYKKVKTFIIKNEADAEKRDTTLPTISSVVDIISSRF